MAQSNVAAVADGPKPVPATRPEMKAALEALKERKPRLPLDTREGDVERRGTVHNGLARRLYLPAAWYAADFRSSPDMTLDNLFKVQLFWIASRANNCQYCLGHQEKKLAMAGQSEDDIAALDFDWSLFSRKHRAAFHLARKLTLQPQAVTRDEVDVLKEHFTDAEIVEIVYTIASYNSVNRWTDSLGLPQDQAFRGEAIRFVTPTSSRYATAQTLVAPLEYRGRPPLEDRREVETRLEQAAHRKPVVELPGADAARERIGSAWPQGVLPNWVQALAYFRFSDGGYVSAIRAVEEGGTLEPELKARIFWTTARHNRAWYSLSVALRRYEQLGISADQAFAMEDDVRAGNHREAHAARFAEKLTVTPQLIEDADLAELREHFADEQVAQLVYVICTANMFDRLTEALQLPVDPRDAAE